MTTLINHIASCKCGNVKFELAGDPIMSPRCSCNDCMASCYYVNDLAKKNGKENISALENGNNQTVFNVLYPKASIKILSGSDKLIYFKMKKSSKALHTYTSCCNTQVLMFCGGHDFNTLGVGSPFNFNTIQPPPTLRTCARVLTSEAIRPKKLPKDDIPNYKMAPFWAIYKVIGNVMTGKKNKDADTLKVLDYDYTTVNEVAGESAYKLAGFKFKE